MVSTFWNIPGIQSNISLGFLEQALNPICIYDDRGQVVYASDQFLELLQAVKQEVRFFNYFPSKVTPRAALKRLWQRALQGNQVEFRTRTRDAWEEIDCALRFNSEANLMFLVAKKTDTNVHLDQNTGDYEQAIAALVRTEEKWKTFVLNSPYLFIQTNHTGQIVYVSPAVENLLGYQEAELLGRYVREFVHPRNLKKFGFAFQVWLNSNRSTNSGLECWWRSKSGQWICLFMQGQGFPSELEIDGVVMSGYNVTDRKYLESKLRFNEEKYQSLVSTVPGAVFRCDTHYMMTFTSNGIETITGYPAATFTRDQRQSYLNIVHADDVELLKDSLLRSTLDRCRCSIEYRIIHADGSVRWVFERKQGVFDQSGGLLWLDGVLVDISDRKRSEAECKQAKATLRRAEAINRAMVRMVPILMRSNCLESLPTVILSKQVGMSN